MLVESCFGLLIERMRKETAEWALIQVGVGVLAEI